MKKFVVFVICLILCVSNFSVSYAGDSERKGNFQGFEWDIDNKGVLTITGSGQLNAQGPWTQYYDEITGIVLGGDNFSVGMEGAFSIWSNKFTSVTFEKGFVSAANISFLYTQTSHIENNR